MELSSTFALLRRYARHVIFAAILGAAVGYTVSNALPKQFESQATVLVGQALTSTNPDLSGLEASLRLSQTYAQLASTRPRLEAVIAKLKLETTPDELIKHLNIRSSSQGPLIQISAQAGTPEEASAIANAVAAQLIETSPSVTGQTRIDEFFSAQLAETQRQIINLQAQLDEALRASSPEPATNGQISALQSQLTTLRSTYAGLLAYTTSTASNSLTVAEPAVPNPDPAAPRPILNAVLAAILAAILAIGLVVIHEQLDDSFKVTTDVEDALGLPVLGTIPLVPGRRRPAFYALDTVLFPRSAAAESFRAIRTNLDAAGPDGPIRSILVTSGLGGEGKTKVAANLAIAFAQTGRKVTLLDADLRRSRIHEMFRLDNTRGLSSLMRSPALGLADVAQTSEVPNLRIVTAGQMPPDPAEMLGSASMRSLLAALAREADVLIIDSSPAIPVTDPVVLSSVVDAVILIVRAGVTRPAQARASVAALTRVGGRVIGVVLNGISAADGQIYGTYGDPVAADPPSRNGDRPRTGRRRQERSLQPVRPSPQPATPAQPDKRDEPAQPETPAAPEVAAIRAPAVASVPAVVRTTRRRAPAPADPLSPADPAPADPAPAEPAAATGSSAAADAPATGDPTARPTAVKRGGQPRQPRQARPARSGAQPAADPPSVTTTAPPVEPAPADDPADDRAAASVSQNEPAITILRSDSRRTGDTASARKPARRSFKPTPVAGLEPGD